MFQLSSPNPPTKLEKAVDRAVIELDSYPVASDEYGAILDRIVKLHKMKEEERPESVSPDTLVTVAGNLIGIAMIIHHEHLNVITSKALGFVIRPR